MPSATSKATRLRRPLLELRSWLCIPIGASLVALAPELSEQHPGWLVAASAGALTHLACGYLLPEVQSEGRHRTVAVLFPISLFGTIVLFAKYLATRSAANRVQFPPNISAHTSVFRSQRIPDPAGFVEPGVRFLINGGIAISAAVVLAIRSWRHRDAHTGGNA